MGIVLPPVFDLLDLPLRDALILDVACALIVHAIYKRYDIDTRHLFVNILLLISCPYSSCALLHHFFVLFYLALATSIVVYRLSPWHPLARYPGPLFAKVSKFWDCNHVYHKQLHDRYGPYVRTGPNELSVADASAIPDILGADGLTKGPIWSGRIRPGTTPPLIAIRTAHEHARSRKPWNRAFNTAGIKGYEPIIMRRALQLVGELEKRKPEVDLASWFIFFATDFMGDMAFGGGFELMREGGAKGVFTMLQAAFDIHLTIAFRPLAVLQHLPWLSYLFFSIPSLAGNIDRFRSFCSEKVRIRLRNGSLLKDLFSYLVSNILLEIFSERRPAEAEIISNGALAVVAGSDTTSSTLGGIFYYLLTHQSDYMRLQKEVDSVFPPGEGDPFDSAKLNEMEFLNAVINESMRLQPSLATSLQRAPEAGSGGKWVGDRFITEGTAIVVPLYALHRDPRYFHPSPDAFWPERWLRSSAMKDSRKKASGILAKSKSGDPEVITNTAAFIPFSYGPENCAGRSLALTELRMVAALIIQRFEILGGKVGDWFNMKTGKLPVVLESRI
ncbi:high nitrogen upregulated cytochrome P450 monooxygenase 2 [Phellopilus nigrolimitatus]|nr:high nitrogen upregulated cytochrome P450 monooxygenase 2 [Phellopilus nigrolimitatus]